ncbi:unnamed protein product [Didymodactylos carnosus]|uniref:Uncharacterized protein n=1 Tax=Didymodactylos carnosus TaxID=1234261 RepID=A0A815JI40_9BILA|nr:unnamed protein product [Didymodactylos carnosus]CAF4277901.1 unnamed protein product [Didymodactylos carnosus]
MTNRQYQQQPGGRDQYLDNCFLLCINRDNERDIPQVMQLEGSVMRDLCSGVSGRGGLTVQRSQRQQDNEQDYDDISPLRQHDYSTTTDQSKQKSWQDRVSNRGYSDRSRDRDYDERDGVLSDRDRDRGYSGRERAHGHDDRDKEHDYYTPNQYSRRGITPQQQQGRQRSGKSDDELSIYEVYIPTDTLQRLSDRRSDQVIIDFENGQSRSLMNQSERGDEYQSEQQQGSNQRHDLHTPYSGPFFPADQQQPTFHPSHQNAVNVRRHVIPQNSIPQNLMEAQLAMYAQNKAQIDAVSEQGQPAAVQQQTSVQPSSTIHQSISRQPQQSSPFGMINQGLRDISQGVSTAGQTMQQIPSSSMTFIHPTPEPPRLNTPVQQSPPRHHTSIPAVTVEVEESVAEGEGTEDGETSSKQSKSKKIDKHGTTNKLESTKADKHSGHSSKDKMAGGNSKDKRDISGKKDKKDKNSKGGKSGGKDDKKSKSGKKKKK